MCDCLNDCSCTVESTQGDSGDAATIEIGSVTTGAAGSNAAVLNVGTPTNAELQFTIPQGDQGIAGETSHGVLNNTASTALTESQSGTVVYLNSTELVADTLPVNPSVGTYFIFRCTQAATTGYTVTATSAKFVGYIIAKKSATADVYFTPNGTANNVITLNGSTTGGLVGTDFMVQYVGASKWSVSGWYVGSGTLATPFSG